jgi:pimeloyl-ACP methyl ester carboxylesterase
MSISLLGMSIDYQESGAGPCLVLVPGSFATTAAWRPIADILKDDFRIVSTSLPGYGETEERRTEDDTSIDREAEVIEAVIERAGSRVHLVGHSHGGAVVLAVAFRRLAPITSLALIEPMVCDLLRQNGDAELFAAVRGMSAAYVGAYRAGEKSAARRVLDFWAGAGSFDRLPVKVQAYVEQTTPTNILDWQSVYGLDRPISDYASLDFPVSIMRGTSSHPAARQISATLARIVPRARLAEIANASHFVINTHPREVARLISEHAAEAERQHRKTS